MRHQPRTCHALGRAFLRQGCENFCHRPRLHRLFGKIRPFRGAEVRLRAVKSMEKGAI